jgi:hypothetical protein
MYCSSCGSGVVHGLAYCNQCGSKLVAAQASMTKGTDSSIESLIWAIVGVFVGGIGVIIGLMAVLKNELNFDTGLLVFFSLLTFGLMTAIEAVFIWMLLSRNRAMRVREPEQKIRETKELAGGAARVLAEPMGSVTEQTTRTFEPVYEKRK